MTIGEQGVDIALLVNDNARTDRLVLGEVNFNGNGFGNGGDFGWSLGDSGIDEADEGEGSSTEEEGCFHVRVASALRNRVISHFGQQVVCELHCICIVS